VSQRIVDGLPRCAASTSAYCQARGRLPTEMISELARQVGGMIGGMIGTGAPRWWHFWNRPVRLVDGATATMADTAEN